MSISNATDQSNVSFAHHFTLTVALNDTDDKVKIFKKCLSKTFIFKPTASFYVVCGQ